MKHQRTFLNSGHHNNDEGARYGFYTESEINKKIRDHAKKKLLNGRYIPDNLDLEHSIRWVEDELKSGDDLGDLAIDIHLNFSKNKNVKGCEVYFLHDHSLAQSLSAYVSKKTGLTNRGARHMSESRLKNLGWLEQISCNSLLIEVCYPSNDFDRLFIGYPMGQIKAGWAIAEWCNKFHLSGRLSKRFKINRNLLLNILTK